jgi:hypothetical protein
MAALLEPLLPDEEPRRIPLRLWLLIGGAVVGLGGAAAIVFLRSSPPPTTAANPSAPTEGAAKTEAKKGPNSPAMPLGAEEKAAQELYQAAESFDRGNPSDPGKVAPKYLEVFHHHPTTAWGRKAEQKARQLQRMLEDSLEREFQGVKKDSAALAAAGHYLDAIEAVQNYMKEQPGDAPRRRGEREIVALQNASREAFNLAARQAGELAKKGGYAEAIATFERLREGAILEVSERCSTAISQLREAQEGYDAFLLAQGARDALRTFREGPGSRARALFRARRYEEGLKEFDVASADPAAAPLKDDLARERTAIGLAAAFWEAFLKTLRAKATQDLSIAAANSKESRMTGRLVRVGPDRVTIDTGDATAEVTFDKIHLDQIVAWTIGKSLPADEPATYAKAALFFFLDGRDDLARTYLATAKELGADIAESERVFREGLLRAAAPPK